MSNLAYCRRLILFLFRQRFDSRQLLAFQELQRRPAAGRNVRDFIGNVGSFHGRHGISAAYDRSCARILSHGVSQLECPLANAGISNTPIGRSR